MQDMVVYGDCHFKLLISRTRFCCAAAQHTGWGALLWRDALKRKHLVLCTTLYYFTCGSFWTTCDCCSRWGLGPGQSINQISQSINQSINQ